jgi:hypothetical protein
MNMRACSAGTVAHQDWGYFAEKKVLSDEKEERAAAAAAMSRREMATARDQTIAQFMEESQAQNSTQYWKAILTLFGLIRTAVIATVESANAAKVDFGEPELDLFSTEFENMITPNDPTFFGFKPVTEGNPTKFLALKEAQEAREILLKKAEEASEMLLIAQEQRELEEALLLSNEDTTAYDKTHYPGMKAALAASTRQAEILKAVGTLEHAQASSDCGGAAAEEINDEGEEAQELRATIGVARSRKSDVWGDAKRRKLVVGGGGGSSSGGGSGGSSSLTAAEEAAAAAARLGRWVRVQPREYSHSVWVRGRWGRLPRTTSADEEAAAE